MKKLQERLREKELEVTGHRAHALSRLKALLKSTNPLSWKRVDNSCILTVEQTQGGRVEAVGKVEMHSVTGQLMVQLPLEDYLRAVDVDEQVVKQACIEIGKYQKTHNEYDCLVRKAKALKGFSGLVEKLIPISPKKDLPEKGE